MVKTLRLSMWLAAAIGAGPGLSANAAAPEACAPIQREQVTQLFDQWNLALASLNADQVSQRYWPDAVLLPTVSNLPRTTPALVHDYFEHFVAKHPRGRIDSCTVQLGCNTAIDVGTYTFSLMDDQGRVSEVAARYTFVYQYRNGEWRILHHHSSAMPEPVAATTLAKSAVPHASEPASASSAAPSPVTAPALGSAPTAAAGPVALVAAAPVNAAAMHELKPTPAPAKPATASTVEPRHERKASATATLAASATTPAPIEAAAAPAVAAEPNKPVAGGTQMFLNAVASPKLADFYPPAGKPKGLKGTVSMRVCAAPTGKLAGAPTILRSSGSPDLDAAAAAWARAAHWVPATLDRKPVEGCTDVEVPARS